MAAGRKRKPGVIRTKSGRASVAKEALQEHLPAVETRMRLWGLSFVDAMQPNAGTVVGRMCLRGPENDGIDSYQHQAALHYLMQRDAYKKALGAPDSFTNASSFGPGEVDDELAELRLKKAIKNFEDAQAALVRENCEPSNRGHNLLAAMDFIVVRNQNFPHMNAALRVALNRLVRLYGFRN